MSSERVAVFDSIARSTVNSVWGALTIEVLVRLGVETVITSPGSRSTPLTVAAARNPKMEALSILDERSAAFFALGLAKRTRKPVALVCTSGSALANYHPAIIEASMSGTPLLVLTADRPSELRACGSGQTIDQIKFFGESVRAFYELAVPEASGSILCYLRQTLVHAVDRSISLNPGPVHLNFPFRDPLPPNTTAEPVITAEELERAATILTRSSEAVVTPSAFDTVALERLASHQCGLIVVGHMNPKDGDEGFADAVAMLADKLGWPVLTDAINPLRGHASENSRLIAHYDTFLRDEVIAGKLQPQAVLQIGTLPTSKVLRQWLSQVEPSTFLLLDRPHNTDPLHQAAVVLHGHAHDLAESLTHQRASEEWVQQWTEQEQKSAQAIEQKMESTDTLFEGKVAWLLSKKLPMGTSVFLASSMSVRYAEYFWEVGNRAYTQISNRGANGIDGTLGTAMGMAHGGPPAVLLTGDLAFLHDSNALLAQSQLKGSLTIVLINNNGGGIFEHLPIANQDSVFEGYFATPQNVDLAQLCEAHGIAHQAVHNWSELEEAVAHLPKSGIRVLELQTDRKRDRSTLQSVLSR